MASKKQLAVLLSKLKVFTDPSARLEQYPTDSEIAAEVLWSAWLNGDIEGRTVADLGCGTGILGIGALELGAKDAVFVDIDPDAISVLKENIEGYEDAKVINADISSLSMTADTVMQNPPFGAKRENRNADRAFLDAAFRIAPVVYSFHKAESKAFISKYAEGKGYAVTAYYEFDFPLKMTQPFHKKRIEYTKVGCWRLERKSSTH